MGHGCTVAVVVLPSHTRPAGHVPEQVLLLAPGALPMLPAGHGMQKPAEGARGWSLYLPAGQGCRCCA